MKVMIVEDHKGVRRMIRSFLSDLVDEFVECSDGSTALEAYRRDKPDVVLMDIKMPITDGLTSARRIHSAFPEAFIVIVSQWDGPTLREEAQSAGATAYVSKSDLAPLRALIGDRL